MAYNTKSPVGQFNANQGQDGTGQTDLFKQNLNAIPLNQGQRNNLALNQGQRNNTPLGKDVIKVVDLMSMDQFGHNISKLRKDLSIVDARQVNSDKEYGVLQIEEDLAFNSVNEIPIVDRSDDQTQIYTRAIPVGKVEDSKNLDGITKDGNLVVETNSDTILLPHLSVVNGKKIYGLNACSNGQVVFKSQEDTISLFDDGNMNAYNIVILNNEDLVFNIGGSGVNVVKFSMTISIDDTETSFLVNGKVASINNGTPVEGETGYTSSGTTKTATVGTFDFETGIVAGLFIKTIIGGVTSPEYEVPIRVNTWDWGGPDDHVEQFTIKSNDFIGLKIPQCSIVFTATYDNEKSMTKSWRFSKSSSMATSNLWFVDNVGNILDWSYYNYAVGYKFNSTKSISCTTIKRTGLDYIIIGDSPDTVFGFSTGYKARYRFISYVNLLDINSRLSIGIIKRNNYKLQIGAKWLNGSNSFSYITSANDSYYPVDDFIISDFSIVSTSQNGVNFTATIGDVTKYYSIMPLEDIEGNKLINGSNKILMMTALDIERNDLYESILIGTKPSAIPSVSARLIAVDDSVYVNVSDNFNVDMVTKGSVDNPSLVPTVMILSSSFGLRNSLLQYRYGGEFVSDNLCLFLPCGCGYSMYESYDGVTTVASIRSANATMFRHISQINSFDKTLGSFSSLPLRMEDEYPDISSRSKIHKKSIVMGKSSFVSTDGELYETGSLFLCRNNRNPLLYELGAKSYFCTQYVFLSKPMLTSIYQFTELGMQLILSIEDEVICNPVKTSVGILAVGRTGIWTITDQGAVKIYDSPNRILQASLKTGLDNSAIAVLDANTYKYPLLCGSDLSFIQSSDSLGIAASDLQFAAVTINQFGNVSHQEIVSDFSSATFIDFESGGDLIVIDLTGSNTVNRLENKPNDADDVYSITSNQNIEMYGESISGQLIGLELFATGTGTIDVSVSGGTTQTITVNSPNRYSSYKVGLSEQMSMLDYTIEISSGVKIMQRILGKVILMEKFNG